MNSRQQFLIRPHRASYRKHVLRAVLAGVALGAATGASAETRGDVCMLLKQKTQDFSDAGQRGDGKTMGAMLDDGVIFYNENGDQSTKADMASGGPPPPAGVTTRMTVEDWSCKLYGDVAVASFIDDQQQDFHGQDVRAKFRSVETWHRMGADWKMIGSQTAALFDDPKPATLPPAMLDDYAGTYQAGPGVAITFSREGDALIASANGGPKSRQAAEIRDVFFTPGRPRYRKLFQRDANGRVTGFLYRHEGHDILFTRI